MLTKMFWYIIDLIYNFHTYVEAKILSDRVVEVPCTSCINIKYAERAEVS